MKYTDTNRTNWNDRAHAHHDSEEVSAELEKLKSGQTTLKRIEQSLIGNIEGKKVLHLMCHNGLDSISLSRMGAKVTAVDISEESIEFVKKYGESLGVTDISFIRADIHEEIEELEAGSFDLVFMTYGILCWLGDLRVVFTKANSYLKENGILLLVDGHPILDLFCFDGREVSLAGEYFYQKQPETCIRKKSYSRVFDTSKI